MPVATHRLELPIAAEVAFAQWRQAASRILWTPPEFRLEQTDGPAEASLGVRWKWKMRRWGMTQHLETAVTACALADYEETQLCGPLPRWVHHIRFESNTPDAVLVEQIDFEAPGGMLGLWLTAGKITQEIQAGWAYRDDVWRRSIGKS